MRDDVVVVSSGGLSAGWSTSALGVKTDDEVLRIFGAMVDSLLPQLMSQPNILLVIRAALDIPSCLLPSPSPNVPSASTTSALTPAYFNAIWLAALERHDPDKTVTWLDYSRMEAARAERFPGSSTSSFSSSPDDAAGPAGCGQCETGLMWSWANLAMWDALPPYR